MPRKDSENASDTTMESPFCFLQGEDNETIRQVHGLLNGYTSKPEKLDQSIVVWLTKENRKEYENFKNELKTGIPLALASLPSEHRMQIYTWVLTRYNKKPDYEVKESSLGEIFQTAKNILENFEKTRAAEGGFERVETWQCHPDKHATGTSFIQSRSSDAQGNYMAVMSQNGEKMRHSEQPAGELEQKEQGATSALYHPTAQHQNLEEQHTEPNPQPDNVNSSNVGSEEKLSPEISTQNFEQNGTNYDDKNYRNQVHGQDSLRQVASYQESNSSCMTSSMAEGYDPERNGSALDNSHRSRSSSPPPVPPRLLPDLPDDENSLNIILIGETGVGKTTFVNAFQNHLKYTTLDEALDGGPLVPIRTSFDMVIEDSKLTGIKIEPSFNAADYANEPLFTKKGESRTQNAKIHKLSYTFEGAERIIRLVDTPGVLDTRGDDKDKENYYNTMEIIKDLKNIHAVCLLLKPNESRLSPEVIHALDFLLLYLPRSAVQRIVICFTHTEPFDFVPSQTLCTLEEYLKDFETRTQIRIPATPDNIFSFDNNSFRFQCAVKLHPQFCEKKEMYERSWNNNTYQLQRMLGYIHSLTPYSTADAVSIARIERRLRNLVDTFISITLEHVKETNKLKASRKIKYLSTENKEIGDRKDAFDFILKCCTYFTGFLQRNSCGIEDIFGIKLQRLIMEEEKNYNCCKSAEGHAIITELKRITADYSTKTKELLKKTKKTFMATPSEIEKILGNVCEMNYYGRKVADAEAMNTEADSFRKTHV